MIKRALCAAVNAEKARISLNGSMLGVCTVVHLHLCFLLDDFNITLTELSAGYGGSHTCLISDDLDVFPVRLCNQTQLRGESPNTCNFGLHRTLMTNVSCEKRLEFVILNK